MENTKHQKAMAHVSSPIPMPYSDKEMGPANM